MSDIQLTFTRKQANTLLKMLEAHEETLRAQLTANILQCHKPLARILEAKQDEALSFIDILEKRLEAPTREQSDFIGKHERMAFTLAAKGKDWPGSELPDQLLEELEELGISEDRFMEAYRDAFSLGREQYDSIPKRAAHIDAEEQREAAMQAGMAFGCDGYNDVMGY